MCRALVEHPHRPRATLAKAASSKRARPRLAHKRGRSMSPDRAAIRRQRLLGECWCCMVSQSPGCWSGYSARKSPPGSRVVGRHHVWFTLAPRPRAYTILAASRGCVDAPAPCARHPARTVTTSTLRSASTACMTLGHAAREIEFFRSPVLGVDELSIGCRRQHPHRAPRPRRRFRQSQLRSKTAYSAPGRWRACASRPRPRAADAAEV